MQPLDSIGSEIYALLVTGEMYPWVLNKAIKWESPDWKDESDNFGLEVTHAINKHIGYTEHVMAKYLDLHIERIPPKVLDSFAGWTYFQKGKLTAISDSRGLVNGNRHVSLLLDSLREKLDKLSKHFTVCRHNFIFLYSYGYFSEEDKTDLSEKISNLRSEYKIVFEKIIISAYDEILCFSSEGDLVKNFADIPICNLTDRARQYQNKSDWKKGTPFYLINKEMNPNL